MMRSLKNSGLGQIILGAIVAAIIAAFLLTGTAPTGGGASDECVAQVGDKICISAKEFESSYRLLSAIGGGSINEAAAKRLRLREQVARGLVERDLLVAEAKRLKLATSKDDIDQELIDGRARISLPANGASQLALSLAMCVEGRAGCEPGTIGLRAIDVKKDGKFDIDVYKRTVRVWARRSPNHFKEMQTQEYTAERLRQLIRSGVRVSENEAFLAYSRLRSKVTARSVTAKTSWFERFLVSPTEEEVSAFVKENAESLKGPFEAKKESYPLGCPLVSEIRLNAAQPGSDESEAVKKKADALLLQLKIQKDFEGKARSLSEADSAQYGGRIGCITDSYGAGSAVLQEEAKKLKKPGDLSPVIETIRGYSILRLEAVLSEKNREKLIYEELGYKGLSQRKAEAMALDFSKRLIERAASASLEDATKALSYELLGIDPTKLKEDEEPLAMRNDQAPRVSISKPVSVDQDVVPEVKAEEGATYALFDLKEEDELVKKPLPAENGFVVLQLKSKEELTKEAFEDDRERILQTMRQRKGEQALSEYVDALIKKAGSLTFNPRFIPPEGQDEESAEDS